VDHIHLGIPQQRCVVRISFFHTERVADGIQFLRRPLADSVHVGQGMTLVNRNKLRSEPQADDGDVDFPLVHSLQLSPLNG